MFLISNIRRCLTLALITAVLTMAQPASADPKKGKEVERPTESSAQVVNINTASEEQLQYLPGIGPSKAQAIIKYRDKAKFGNTQQITRVKGIGRKTFLKLRPHLTIKGDTTLTSKLKLKRGGDED